MGHSIAPATWFFVRILMQDFTMKAKAAVEQELKFFYPKTIPCPGGTFHFSLLPILLNASYPPIKKQKWEHF